MGNKCFLLIVFLCIVTCLQAQIRFSCNPAAVGRNVDALLNIAATNNTATASAGDVIINVSEENSGKSVVTIAIKGVQLLPGINSISRFRGGAVTTYYENELSLVLKNTGAFAPAEYQICCGFEPDNKVTLTAGQQCFINTVAARLPLFLISPSDSICNFRPPLIWQGRKSNSPNVAFKIVLAEIKKGQTGEEALRQNNLMINEVTFQQINQLPFPVGSPSLKEGKTYAWQVFEMAGDNLLNSSEIFEFTSGCKSDNKQVVKSFAEVKPYYTGRKYVFTNTIDFAFENPYSPTNLSYSIIHVATQKKLTNLPIVKMQSGLNKIRINTEDIRGLQMGEQYKLLIYNLESTVQFLNFIVKE